MHALLMRYCMALYLCVRRPTSSSVDVDMSARKILRVMACAMSNAALAARLISYDAFACCQAFSSIIGPFPCAVPPPVGNDALPRKWV